MTCPRPLWPSEQCRAMNRCVDCGHHPETQGHHGNCPNGSQAGAAPATLMSTETERGGQRGHT